MTGGVCAHHAASDGDDLGGEHRWIIKQLGRHVCHRNQTGSFYSQEGLLDRFVIF